MDKLKDAVISKRVNQLINEVAVGEHTIDVLSNTSLALSDERQVEYFSHARENIKKDVAYIIMTNNQNFDDLSLLKELIPYGRQRI